MINTGKTTLKQALENQSLDLRILGMAQRFEDLEKQVGWHGRDDSANRNTLKSTNTDAQCFAILNDLKTKYTAHIALGAPTHKAADSTNTISAAAATDLASAYTLANELKTDFNAHRVLATSHDPGSTTGVGNAAASTVANLDRVNYVTSADASTSATLKTLTNELQVKYRRHTFRGPIGIDDQVTL